MLKLPETYDLFPILITKVDISGYDEEDDVVEHVLQDRDLGSHGLLQGDAKTSKTRNFLDSYPTLKSQIQLAVDMYATKVGLLPLKTTNAWYGVYKNGGKIDRHNHANSQVSGAYYPYVEFNQTSIVFDNPTMVLRPTDIFNNISKYSEPAKEIVVQSGDLVLFPSWIYHYTDPNTSGKRCVISFDTQFKG
jgi:uncharacterized protein (TIGR02466 family)|tara:strand:- start:52 stop:624 length:573 start_codon:yes stop_codon:yes gene_type:complete